MSPGAVWLEAVRPACVGAGCQRGTQWESWVGTSVSRDQDSPWASWLLQSMVAGFQRKPDQNYIVFSNLAPAATLCRFFTWYSRKPSQIHPDSQRRELDFAADRGVKSFYKALWDCRFCYNHLWNLRSVTDTSFPLPSSLCCLWSPVHPTMLCSASTHLCCVSYVPHIFTYNSLYTMSYNYIFMSNLPIRLGAPQGQYCKYCWPSASHHQCPQS